MSNKRTVSASLSKQTALYNQPYKSNGYPVGCGTTAWAIVLDYWKRHKAKSTLLNDGPVSLATMEEIAKAIKTTYGTYKGNKYGRTMPLNMKKITDYVAKHGYKASIDRDRGTEFSKFKKVKESLQKDRPVIILINNPAKALSSLHYAIIEKAELNQEKKLGKWRDRDVRYYVNMGNKSRKWIWVREWGRNQHDRTGSFSMFHLSIV